ncbi:peptidoglycan recognition family protein [Leptothoe sp. PORK10 BA2]|nr:peptidoglycan recognition family protein [Leptothoe sp. PORK10 BA2]
MLATIVLATTYKTVFEPQIVATTAVGAAAIATDGDSATATTNAAELPPAESPPVVENGFIYAADQSTPAFRPPERVALADPSNYGERFTVDANGNPLNQDYIAVLHETVWSADSAINTFQRHNPQDEDQSSYHTIIDRDGTVIYIVPPEKRAFGAGNSVFDGPNGPETALTNPNFPPSVNNFAYHISLVTPSDGQNNAPNHSGYTDTQYQSLAWLIAQTTIPEERIVTHAAVDRSETRQDPRSFNWPHFLEYLNQYPSRQA